MDIEKQEGYEKPAYLGHLSDNPYAGRNIIKLTSLIVNVYFVNDARSPNDWVLVDTGLSNSADKIKKVAETQFEGAPPRAIILTHGHFDHIGAVEELMTDWDVPVFAHEMELPYLMGEKDYPPGDPSVGGGLMARVSPLYPHHSINLGDRVKPLPSGGKLPFMEDWRWIHTPGHSPGHVSLFRDYDRTLISGDAFITVKQESAFAVLTQDKEVHGPPAYFTTDWHQAWESVKKLEALEPEVAFTGHGQPMSGLDLEEGLNQLAIHFDTLAIPDHGRYVN